MVFGRFLLKIIQIEISELDGKETERSETPCVFPPKKILMDLIPYSVKDFF